MPSFEATTIVAAPAERIWPVLADVARWPQWLPTVTSVEPLGQAPLALGASYRIVQPRLRPGVWSVVELVPGSHFSWQSRAPGVRVLATHVLRPISSNATGVTLGVAMSGALAGLAGMLVGRLTREYLERECAALKQTVESLPS